MATVTHERSMDPMSAPDGDRVDDKATTTTTTTGVMKMDSERDAGDAGTGTGTAGRKKSGNGTKRKRKIEKLDDSPSLFWLVEVRLFVCLFFDGWMDGPQREGPVRRSTLREGRRRD